MSAKWDCKVVYPRQHISRMEEGQFSLVDCWMRRIPTKFFRKSRTPKPSWRFGPSYIKVLFEGKSRNMMVDLGRKFQTTRCGEDDDVHVAHFSKLAHLHEKLSALGRAISNDKYIAVLIGSLPSCYDSPIDSLTSSCNINQHRHHPTAIIRAATCEYEKHVLCKENKVQDEAFTAAKADKNA